MGSVGGIAVNNRYYIGLGTITMVLFDIWLIIQIFGLGHVKL